MTHIVHPILLAGGSGTRLWPLSRKSYPKQFAKLMGEHSLFQASAKRLAGAGFAAPVILTGADYRFVVTEQLAAMEIAPAGILIEPDGRNTAPAILAAALELAARAPEALMLVAPSDHVIPDAAGFRAAVQAATSAAFEGQLVTFGIRPDRAETGYGWLEMSQAPAADFASEPQPLKGFVENLTAPRQKRCFKAGSICGMREFSSSRSRRSLPLSRRMTPRCWLWCAPPWTRPNKILASPGWRPNLGARSRISPSTMP